jgi:hypothetical protein
MRHRHALVLAILVYISLDLSSAAVPGAFMLETSDFTEDARVARVRVRAVDTLPHLPADESSFALSQLRPEVTRRLGPPLVPPPFRRHWVTNRLPRAAVDPAAPSEDRH